MDSTDLDPIVQAVLNDDSATVTGSLNCEPTGGLSMGQGTQAILKISGIARTASGEKAWSTVLKVVSIDDSYGDFQNNPRTEVDAYDSRLLEKSPGLRTTRCYRLDRLPDQEVWLWLEDLSGWIGPPWDSREYERASEDIGLFSGHWSTQELPSAEFLVPNGTATRFTLPNMAEGFMKLDPGVDPEPVMRSVLPERTYRSVMRFDSITSAARPFLESGAEIFSHGDCHPRNLFLSPEEAPKRETVAVDLAGVGAGYLGTDIGTLLGSGMTWHIDEFRMILSSEHLFFDAYLKGLLLGGWQGDRDVARFNFLFPLCRYGMSTAGVAVAIGNHLPRRDFFAERSGEESPEEAFESYTSRLPLLEPLAEELESLAERLQ